MNGGKTVEGRAESDGGRGGSRWRIAAWAAAGLILLVPLVAMQFTDEVVWTVGDFVFAGVLLFGSLGAYEIAARKTGDAMYRAGVGLAIGATFLLLWGNGALYITDSAADVLYFGVAAIGIIGIIVALFRPGGGARVLLATAFMLGVVFVIALLAGMVPNEYASVFEVFGITGFYAALFVGAAWLLRKAVRREPERGAA